MYLQKLDIYNVRNIREETLNPSPTFNFFYGENASGKSALVEAVYLVGRAKSFRTSIIKSAINFEADKLIVSAQIAQSIGPSRQIGVQLDGKDVEIRINQQSNQNRATLAELLPTQIIHPKSFELLDAGAQIRREFLDWGIFNEDNTYLLTWRKYKKALSQRNALLKTKTIKGIHLWDSELINYGKIVNSYRSGYLENLKPFLLKAIKFFFEWEKIDIKLITGWDETRPLASLLNEDLERDLRYGFTHSGPHRGDFRLLVNNVLAKDRVSRGQLKLLVICLKLAQVEMLNCVQGSFGCVLIDDFAAEIDIQNRKKILTYLNKLKCQVFITATEAHDFGKLDFLDDHKMFHVEQGKIREVNVPCGTSLN